MHIAIINRDNRPWPRPRNHYDGRVCPDCGTTVHGPQAQAKHRAWHLHVNTLMQEFAKRTGLAEEQFEGRPWEWGADITGTEDEIKAAE